MIERNGGDEKVKRYDIENFISGMIDGGNKVIELVVLIYKSNKDNYIVNVHMWVIFNGNKQCVIFKYKVFKDVKSRYSMVDFNGMPIMTKSIIREQLIESLKDIINRVTDKNENIKYRDIGRLIKSRISIIKYHPYVVIDKESMRLEYEDIKGIDKYIEDCIIGAIEVGNIGKVINESTWETKLIKAMKSTYIEDW